MRITQQVKRKLNTKSSINIGGIISQLDGYDIVSFDIFDTLLKRNVKKPTDVFKYMEKSIRNLVFLKKEFRLSGKQEIKKETKK